MDLKKNKKKLVTAGAAAILCLVLLVLSSSLKNKRSASRERPPVATADTTTAEQPDNASLSEAWVMYDDRHDLLKQSRHGDAAVTSESPDVHTDTEPEPAIPVANEYDYEGYPAPSFVSSGGDTLIYKNGIYVRVDWVIPPTKKPDTLLLHGKKYIEILEE